MAKTTQEILAQAKEKLKTLSASEAADAKAAVALRMAKKKVKRAQRKTKVEKTMGGKRESYEANRLKNIEKANEKVAKKKAAAEAALNAAAEKQAAAAGAEG
ncbi:MAG: hypothetical protein HZB29_08975 [Nitrospinae bacterium]|nr:hypothetical protein [Nitrospinota bacterium]